MLLEGCFTAERRGARAGTHAQTDLGDALELACGTARNLPFYAEDVQLTGIELSPEMLEIGRRRARELGHPADLRPGDRPERERTKQEAQEDDTRRPER